MRLLAILFSITSLANLGFGQNTIGLQHYDPELLDINYVNNNGADDWIHGNSIAYNEERDEIVISSRKMSEIYIIDHSTTTGEAAGHSGGDKGKGGDLLYRWGNPQVYDQGTAQDRKLFGQHDAHWIPEGYPDEDKIIMFNNGRNRTPVQYTSIDIINPPLDGSDNYTYAGGAFGPANTSWTYDHLEDDTLYASYISGAHQLPNGNVLLTDGPGGVLQEVTPDGELAWEYVIPVDSDGPISQGQTTIENTIFRVRRYPVDYPGLPGNLVPGDPIELNPTPDNCNVVYLSSTEVQQNNFAVFPNPSSGVISFHGLNAANSFVSVVNSVGEVVMSLNVMGTDRIDLSDLSTGIYFIQIRLEDQMFTDKLILNR